VLDSRLVKSQPCDFLLVHHGSLLDLSRPRRRQNTLSRSLLRRLSSFYPSRCLRAARGRVNRNIANWSGVFSRINAGESPRAPACNPVLSRLQPDRTTPTLAPLTKNGRARVNSMSLHCSYTRYLPVNPKLLGAFNSLRRLQAVLRVGQLLRHCCPAKSPSRSGCKLRFVVWHVPPRPGAARVSAGGVIYNNFLAQATWFGAQSMPLYSGEPRWGATHVVQQHDAFGESWLPTNPSCSPTVMIATRQKQRRQRNEFYANTIPLRPDIVSCHFESPNGPGHLSDRLARHAKES
jgi:hypothetical protein